MGAMALHIVHVCVPVCIVVGKGHLPADVDLVQISCGMEVQVFHSGLHPGPGHGLTGGLCGKGLMIHIQACIQNAHQHSFAGVVLGDVHHAAGVMHVGLYRSHRGLGRGVGLRHLHRPDTGERGNGFLLPIRRSHGKTIEQQAVCIDNLQAFHGLQLLTSLYLGLLDCIPGLCLYRLQRLSVAALSHTGNQRGFLQFYQERHFLIAVYLQLWLAVRKGIGQQLRMLCRRFY